MWLKNFSYSQLFVAFLLLLLINVMATSAANMAQLKNQQQILGQTSATATDHQQHTPHTSAQVQYQLQLQSQQQQQRLQQQAQQPQAGGIAAHPDKDVSRSANSVLHASNIESQALSSSSPSATSTLAQLPPAHYVLHEKEKAVQEILNHFHKGNNLNDPYQILNELKRDTPNELPPPSPPSVASHPNNMDFPWNFYDRPSYAPITLPSPQMAGFLSPNLNPVDTFPYPFPITPRFLPIMSYPQPIFIPYPFIMSPAMAYPGYSTIQSQFPKDYEDSMSRGVGSSRHPGSSQHSSSYSRNSPIYYVRLPPTPYMFLPSLGFGTTTTPSASAYANVLPYQSLPSFPSLSPVFNVPMNFLANGKPSNIYQMGAPPNDMQNPVLFSNIPSSFNTHPPPPPPPALSSALNAYRPTASSHNYYNTQPPSAASYYTPFTGSSTTSASSSSLSSSTSSSSLMPHQDSKLTALKRPYVFNGRPEDIYVLPSNFNSLYSAESNYY